MWSVSWSMLALVYMKFSLGKLSLNIQKKYTVAHKESFFSPLLMKLL